MGHFSCGSMGECLQLYTEQLRRYVSQFPGFRSLESSLLGFGTGAIPKECGFTLQNRGTGFTLQEGHPNVLVGSKRPYHTIIPAMVTRGDELFLSYGVMGGYMQVCSRALEVWFLDLMSLFVASRTRTGSAQYAERIHCSRCS